MTFKLFFEMSLHYLHKKIDDKYKKTIFYSGRMKIYTSSERKYLHA